ncbi:hypothetical protein EYF80_012396 [Liparis tanakae]|uniref:Uncharacterized protein n=1 Tax=Liparis tanakae TaxID=230148 RepID=A0A4Z2IJJ5_9TELE|nr:hypothetical protein EYF80_012396 [Liparis tanakae]
MHQTFGHRLLWGRQKALGNEWDALTFDDSPDGDHSGSGRLQELDVGGGDLMSEGEEEEKEEKEEEEEEEASRRMRGEENNIHVTVGQPLGSPDNWPDYIYRKDPQRGKITMTI